MTISNEMTILKRGWDKSRSFPFTPFRVRMTILRGALGMTRWVLCGAMGAVLCVGVACAQATGGTAQSGGKGAPIAQDDAKHAPLTKEQAKELFKSVDEILQFVSADTDLPIEHSVKRRLVTRDEVNKMLREKFDEDAGAKRLERSEIVLKKFGLLDRDFHLRPFMISLLTEQVAGYYDNKTKTVNLLDWIAPEEQKPVLAHELTHALQDQKVDLTKWSEVSAQDTSEECAGGQPAHRDGRGGYGARCGGGGAGDGGVYGLLAAADGQDACERAGDAGQDEGVDVGHERVADTGAGAAAAAGVADCFRTARG